MKNILDIRVQKLFLITCTLKIGSSFLGWLFQDPWILGFAVPLLIMGTYIVLGYFRRDNEVTDEKFADTCYYLGFIFTITSIIFSLFDLPHIGTRIQDIAVRFGAAMVSTVLGLAVRVYLVSFKKDVADAIKDAEDAVLDATRKFTEQLNVALERLRDFESQVDTAAKTSVERVNLQVETLSKNHADKLTSFFNDLTNKNQEAFTSALSEVKSASQKLAESVDGYSLGMRANLVSIEAKVGAFADAVTERLKTTTFPDDYFAEHLKSPLSQLKDSSSALATGIKSSLQEVTESTTVLSLALKKLRDKASATEGSIETVLKLTQQQQAVLNAAQGQVTSLEQLGATLTRINDGLSNALAGFVTSNGLSSELTGRVSGLIADGAETRKTLEAALTGVTETLKAQVQATHTVVKTLDVSTAANQEFAHTLAGKLDTSIVAAESAATALTAATNASTAAVGKLDAVAVAEMKAAQAFDALGQQATLALSRVDGAMKHFQGMVHQLTKLDATLRALGSESKIAEQSSQVGSNGVPSPAGVSSSAFTSSPDLPLPLFQQTHNALQVELAQPAFSNGQEVAPIETHPSFPPTSSGQADTFGHSSRNGSSHVIHTTEGPAEQMPATPQIQVPPLGFKLLEQGIAEMPRSPQQPPSK